MCGLVGVAGKVTVSEESAFKLMLALDTVRGEDSTGMLSVSTTGSTNVLKEVCNGFEIRGHRKFSSFFAGSFVALMGHNRAATRGKVTRFNAHPFEIGNIIGAHNGTLISQYNLKDGSQFDVDSEAIFNHINSEGIVDLARKCNGAFALTWYDKSTRTMNFLRNDERTLYFALSEDGKTIFWASEPWIFQVACSKNGIKIGEHQPFEVGKLYQVPLSLVPSTQAPTVDLQVSEKLELYVPPYQQGNFNRGKAFPPARTQTMTGGGTTGDTKVTAVGAVKVGDTVEVEVKSYYQGISQAHVRAAIVGKRGIIDQVRIYADYGSALWRLLTSSQNNFLVKVKRIGNEYGKNYFVADLRSVQEIIEDSTDTNEDDEVYILGPRGRYIPISEWEKLLQTGCSYCEESNIDPDKADEVIWLAGNQFVCPCCVEKHKTSMSMTI